MCFCELSGSGQMCGGWEWHGGEIRRFSSPLHQLRTETSDRIVIISNYTQTLDLVEVLCRQNRVFVSSASTDNINKRLRFVNAILTI